MSGTVETCAFCPEPAPARACMWIVEKFARTAVRGLRVGDVIRSWTRPSKRWKVARIDGATDLYRSVVVIELADGSNTRPKGTQPFANVWALDSYVDVLRELPCAACGCEQHARDLIGGYICMNHWPSQLAAIEGRS